MSRVETISELPPAPFVPPWHDVSSPDHFWFRWRLEATRRLLDTWRAVLPPDPAVLEGLTRARVLAPWGPRAWRWVERWVVERGVDRLR